MKNNLRSIADSMYAAGVEFVPEDQDMGLGVRFRERKLEYITSVRVDGFNDRATMRMRYAGQDFLCYISLSAVEDYYRSNFQTDDEFGQAISKIQHIILAAAERNAPTEIRDGELLITSEMLEGAT